ncbi:MAG: PilZ domain-containing protein [Proteobacteria bacterium]|nr:PilZ domain-containing protein [Pseudomonadota bacterium]
MTSSTLKILFVDEKRMTSDLEKAGYRKIGAHIIQATNFAQAQDILNRDKIDVIVINFDFAGIDASSMCEHFKKQASTQEVPVIFTSVQPLPKRVTSRELGPDLFVETPVPREFFIEQIRNLLEEKTRGTERVVHEGSVSFDYRGKNFQCSIQDVSKSGIFLTTEIDIEEGTKLSLSFCLPGYKKPIKVEGEVVRHIAADPRKSTPAGIGIRFDDFNGDSQKRLDKYIAKTQHDDPKLVYYL